MIEHIKRIINTLIEKANDIEFKCVPMDINPCIEDEIVKYPRAFAIEYKINNRTYIIILDDYKNVIRFGDKHEIFDMIKCSQEDFAEVNYLMSKLNKIYIKKETNKFIHSLDN